ncbi:MAG: glycoside hydrolase family 16 protein [Paludibacteraceae bacterium]|nr:glycoside hydrolase family 16 protein [Paludibacteraceae bacterium]
MEKIAKILLSVMVIFMCACCHNEPNDNKSEKPTLKLSCDKLALVVGDQYALMAEMKPYSNSPLVWQSSNEDVCSVFQGMLIARNVGDALIIVSCDSLSDTCMVEVSLKDYQLVWSDEFDGATLNLENWNIEINNTGCGNSELEYYCEKGVSVGEEPLSGKQCLILTATKEHYIDRECTSGRINTRDKRTFQYGIVEASIKLPKTADGLWPAFWMMGNDISINGWPKCGEIDIMEMGNSHGIRTGTQDRYFNGACHWGFYKNGNYPNYANAQTSAYSLQDDEFHLYRLYWDENKISMYLDQDKYPDVEPYFEMEISDVSDDWSPGHYFHKPNFILLNLAIGGNFTGIWDINQITALSNGPQSMYVDYVRVYQRK